MTFEDFEKELNDLKVTRAEVMASVKSYHKRLDRIENTIESINNIAISVNTLAVEMKSMREDLNSVDNRVFDIEKVPKKRYENIINSLICGLCGAFIGFILSGGVF